MGIIKTALQRMFVNAMMHNRRNILALASETNSESLLDLGCDDGEWTLTVAQSTKCQRIFGVEIVPSAAELAATKGIHVSVTDLKDRLPFDDNSFDLVHANQVIEHVPDIDKFTQEAFRVLKPHGRFIVSTENGSSWHNIFAASMGWQIFSLTNMSAIQSGVGNPLALHRGTSNFASTWTHKVIFNYRGLIEFLRLHQFENVKARGAGYYPLPSVVGSWDVRHAHFLAVSAQKPTVRV